MDRDEPRKQGTRKGQNEPKAEGAHQPKPIPIREAVEEGGPRPAGGSDVRPDVPAPQAPGLRGQRERPQGPRGTAPLRRSDRGRRHGQDRQGASSDREKPDRPPLERTDLEDLPTRRFEHEGSEWIARLCGQATSGSVRDLGAPLMHLIFYTAADPLVSCGEAVVAGGSLEGLPELHLSELLAKVKSAPPANESGR
jgi:hypothetical protein